VNKRALVVEDDPDIVELVERRRPCAEAAEGL